MNNYFGGEDIMFKDIGRKIKTLTKVFFAILVVISIIMNVVGGVLLYSFLGHGLLVFLLVVIAIGLGVLFSWICCFFLYGFGELVDSSAGTAENTQFMLTRLSSKGSSSAFKKTVNKNSGTWECEYCGYENPDIASFCRNCQKTRY